MRNANARMVRTRQETFISNGGHEALCFATESYDVTNGFKKLQFFMNILYDPRDSSSV